MNRSNRGVVDLGLLLVVALAGAVLTGHVALPAFLQKKPPTTQLTQTEKDFQQARAAQSSAEARLLVIEQERERVKDSQLLYAQQMNEGAVLALGGIAPGQVTPEVRLARDFSLRAQAGLAAARGRLDPAQQAEIEKLVGQALSAKEAEIEAYKQAVALKDAALTQTITQKASLEAQIPTLKVDLVLAQAKTATEEAKALTLVKQVSDYADKMATQRAEAGSWEAYFWLVVKIMAGLALAYVAMHIWLPAVAQSYPGGITEKAAQFFRNVTTTHS